MGKVKAGQDKANQISEDTGNLELISMLDIFQDFRHDMQQRGYKLEPHIVGNFCFMNVYFKDYYIPGLEVPEGFYKWTKLSPSSQLQVDKFLLTVKEVCLKALKMDDLGAEYYGAIFKAITDSPADGRTSLAKLTLGMQGRNTNFRVGTLKGGSGAFRVVPQVSWFPEEMRNIDPLSLLNILPEAEAKILMLILGRLMVGWSGSECLEGTVRHKFRSYGVMISEAGIGKSTIQEWLTEALGLLGYTTAQLSMSDTRFGWAAASTADLTLTDDLTEETQRAMYRNPYIKTIVSNGMARVEEKGQPAIDVKCTSVILANSNHHDYREFYGLDAGVLNRLNQLLCFTRSELQEQYGDNYLQELPYTRWGKLSPNGSPITTTMYLLARCAEYFCEVAGYNFEDGVLVQGVDNLEATIKELREQLRIDTSLGHADELPYKASELVALALANSPQARNQAKKAKMIDQAKRMMFSPELLLASLKVFMEDIRPSYFEGSVLTHMSPDVKRYLAPKRVDFDTNLTKSKSIDAAFKDIVAQLVSNKGMNYPASLGFYQTKWTDAMRNLETRVAFYTNALENSEEDLTPALDDVLHTVIKIVSTI